MGRPKGKFILMVVLALLLVALPASAFAHTAGTAYQNTQQTNTAQQTYLYYYPGYCSWYGPNANYNWYNGNSGYGGWCW